jgi:hypothetical protein
MARSRNIKPGFFKNEILAELSAEVRLLFIGLWTIADREGRLEDRPKKIKGELFPYEDRFDVESMLDVLHTNCFLVRYEVEGRKYLEIVNFVKHQDPHYKEKASEIPPPTGETNKVLATNVTRTQRRRILERDNYQCQQCGLGEHLCIDHVLPISRGGDSSDENLQVLCMSCNTKKSNKIDGESSARKKTSDGSSSSYDPSNIRDRLELARTSGEQKSCSPSSSLIPDSLNSDSGFPEVCAEPAAPALFVTLTLNDKSEYPIFETQIAEWQGLYPAVDIRQELRNMRGWCIANPSKRKTKSGILRFVTSWLAKEQNKGGQNAKDKRTGEHLTPLQRVEKAHAERQ